MQRKQGYCSYCRVQYPNLEQHLFSSQHRSLTRQNRHQINNSSLMERFLQDVLQHHPYNYQENSSPNDTPSDATSPDVVCVDEFFPEETSEETSEDSSGTSEENVSESSESVEELYCGPSQYQENAQEVSVRPSVIQKLEKGQQQSLPFFHKIESGTRRVKPVHIGQATNDEKKLIRPPVICNAPASRLPASSCDRPVAATTSRVSLAASLDSVSKYDPNKVGKHFEQLDTVSSDPGPSSHVETSPVSHKNLKESNRKSSLVNSDNLVLQKDVKSQGATLSPDSNFPELKGTENSLRVKSPKLAVNSAVHLNKTGKSSDKGTFEDAIPKHSGEVLSKMDCSQEERLLVTKSSFLEQKCSASSEVEFDYGPLQSASDQSQEAIQDLNFWKEEQGDQEGGSNESGAGSGMSFDCDSSCHSVTDPSEVSDKGTLSEETQADLEYKNNKSCASEVNSNRNDSLQAVTSQSQVTVKETDLQNKVRVSLVDESYDTSGSEMNSDCEEDLPQSVNDCRRQQPVTEVNFPQGVRIDLVDRDYGSSSSEESADSVHSAESADEENPAVATGMKPGKKPRVRLVDAGYGSSYSESSSDSDDASLQSTVTQRQVTDKERKPKDRHKHLKQKKRKSSRAKECPQSDVSLETVADEPQSAVGENNPTEKNADLVDMNCESHGPEMGFHADAQLEADESQVAVKEVNPQNVDIDLDNESVQSRFSYLSSDSHAICYQSANEEPQGALGEINLKELNVDMEVKSSGCSSSELTFDSDSPLLSISEQLQLDFERNEDDFNLEDGSCVSTSSDLTFDSDILDFSVVDQPEVAVNEEAPVDLENKSDESCISEITFDSDIPLHSGIDQPEVAVKEVIIQEEECVLLERKNDKLSGSEISLDSYAPLHSLTNPLEVADKKLSSQTEEQVHLKNKKSEPTCSELNLAYDTNFHSMTGHTEDPIKDINFQKEEHVHLENKSNELSVSKTQLDLDIPLQSMIHKPKVVVKNIWLQKENHAEFQGKNAEFSVSGINSDSDFPHYPMAEPQVPVKKREKKYILEKKNDKHGSELILNSAILPQSMTKKPQLAVLKKDHVHPADESTEIRGFEINLNIDSSLHSVTDQPHMAFLKEKHVDLKDKTSKLSDSKISFTSFGPSQSFSDHHKTVKETDLWKEEAIGLENKINEPCGSKVIHDTDVSPHSTADEPKVAIQQRNLENEDKIYLDIENNQYSSHSDCLVQAIVDQPQITILGPEHIEVEGKHDQSCDSELSFNFDDSLLSLSEKLREMSLWEDEDTDRNEKRNEAESFKIVCNSDALQPVASQTEEIVEESNLWKEPIDMEDKIVKPSNSKIHFYSDEPLPSVTNKIQEPDEEINIPREGHEEINIPREGHEEINIPREEHEEINIPREEHEEINIPREEHEEINIPREEHEEINIPREGQVCVDDKGYEPNGSKITYVSNIPFQSVIQPPKILGEEHANLEVKSSGSFDPKISFDSSDSCQPVAGQLQKTVREINLKENHIYLEDKSYKLVDCGACYDSDVPVQFDQSHVSAKEISLQKKNHNDLESNYTPDSEIRCDSDVHLQSEVDPSQVVCKETNLQNGELGMEEKSSEHSDSEIMHDSNVSFQILVNSSQRSDGESDTPKVVFVASDSDCDREVISDPNIPLELVTDPSQMTLQETSHINAESVETENKYCSFCGSEVRYVSQDPSRPVRNQPKESFKIINRKNDSIILGDSTCQSCGHQIDFNVDTSDQSMTYQSQEPDKTCIDSEDKSNESNDSGRNFNLEDTSQSVIYPLQKADKEVNPCKDPNNIGLEDKNGELSVSAVNCAAPSASVIQLVAGRKSILKVKHTEGSTNHSEMDFQRDLSLQSVTDQSQEAVKKQHKVTFDLREYHEFPRDPCLRSATDQSQEAVYKKCLPKKVTFILREHYFQPDPSLQSVTDQSQEAVSKIHQPKKITFDLREYHNFHRDSSLQSATDQSQEAVNKKGRPKKVTVDPRENDFQPDPSLKSVTDQSPAVINKKGRPKKVTSDLRKHDFQPDPSLQSVTDQSQVAVSKKGRPKKVTSDLREQDFQHGPSLQSATDQSQAVNKKGRPKKVTSDLREQDFQPDPSLQSATDQSQEAANKKGRPKRVTFILREQDFQPDPSLQSVTDQSQEAVNKKRGPKKVTFILREQDFQPDPSLHSATDQSQEAVNKKRRPKKVTFDPREHDFQPATDQSQVAVSKKGRRKKVTFDSREHDFQPDPSLQSATDQSQEAVSKKRRRKKVTFDPREHDFQPDPSLQSVTDQSQEAVSKKRRRKKVTAFQPDPSLQSVNDQSQEAVNKKRRPKKVTADLRKHDSQPDPSLQSQEAINKCRPKKVTFYFREHDFQPDPSLQSATDQSQEVINKKCGPKKVTFNLREYHDTQPRSVPMEDSVRNLEKAKEVMEDVSEEPVLEALPNVPPSDVEKTTWSQRTRENEMKVNSPVEEFKEDHFPSYVDGDGKIQKVVPNEEKRITLPECNLVNVAVQTLHHDYTVGGTGAVGNYSVALEKACCHYALSDRMFAKKNSQVASQGQTEKVSSGTQTNFIVYPLKKRRFIRQEEESPKKVCLESEEKKVEIGTTEDSVSQTNSSDPSQSKSSVNVLSSGNLKPREGGSCNLPKIFLSPTNNEIQFIHKDNQRDLNNSSIIGNDSSVNLRVLESSVSKCGDIHHSGNTVIPSARDNDTVPNLASTSSMTVPARYGLRSRCRTSESSTFLENSEVGNVSEIPEEDNFQLALVSHNVARITSKSVKNEVFLSKHKKNIQKGNVTTSSHPSSLLKAYKAVILQQKSRIVSEKWSIWIRTKANDIIRKYISKYSVFLRHRYQSRATFIGMHSKKKYFTSRLEVERSTQMLLKTSVPPAGAKEQLRAMTNPRRQPVQRSFSVAERQNPTKKYCHRKKKRPAPVREYDLRSSCYIPDSDRMMTRLASKLRNNEVK